MVLYGAITWDSTIVINRVGVDDLWRWSVREGFPVYELLTRIRDIKIDPATLRSRDSRLAYTVMARPIMRVPAI